MTQQEVYKFLQKNKGKKFTKIEIEKKLGYKSVGVNLKKLAEKKEIKRIKSDFPGKSYIYYLK